MLERRLHWLVVTKKNPHKRAKVIRHSNASFGLVCKERVRITRIYADFLYRRWRAYRRATNSHRSDPWDILMLPLRHRKIGYFEQNVFWGIRTSNLNLKCKVSTYSWFAKKHTAPTFCLATALWPEKWRILI